MINVLDALLDSWDRNNIITTNLLRLVPDDALDITPADGSPSIGQLFTHINYVRLVFVLEDAPEFARPMRKDEWAIERDRERLAQMLDESAKAVRDAVAGRVKSGRAMDTHYDHPILMLQHLIWHEGYHHGQIKLALKLAGRPISDDEAGPGTWDIWMQKEYFNAFGSESSSLHSSKTGGPMLTHFPQAVPEIPVSNVDQAAKYYVNVLGFSFDWGNDEGGIGGISQGDCRMFLTNAPFRAVDGPKAPVIVWLNLNSKHEVDELFERWRQTGAKILAAVEDKPWNLREFRVADLDGNQLRVFYDFSRDFAG